jgi:two-component system KDP operon response regulator KdpE
VSASASTLVVIEDDPQIRRFLRTGLSAEPFRIFEAETGKAGLVETATRKPDLVILDLGLPDRDGVDVVAELREWYTRPIIILSARSNEQEKIKALDAGADDYLTKPFGIGELLARIRAALRRSASDAYRIPAARRARPPRGQGLHATATAR